MIYYDIAYVAVLIALVVCAYLIGRIDGKRVQLRKVERYRRIADRAEERAWNGPPRSGL